MSTLGRSRRGLAAVLNTAFAEGLISEHTHSYRLGLLYGPRLIDQQLLVGDLTLRSPRWAHTSAIREAWTALACRVRAVTGRDQAPRAPVLLALDRAGTDRLFIGRHPSCDIVVREPTVSRRHAQLTFRDGTWVLQDLGSTNGTCVNGARVGRMAVRTGDIVTFGNQTIQLD